MTDKSPKEIMFDLLSAIHGNLPEPNGFFKWDDDASPLLEILKKETKTNENLGADEVFDGLQKLVSEKETAAGAMMIARMAGDFCLGVALDCRDLMSNRSDILSAANVLSGQLSAKVGFEDSLSILIDRVEEQTK